MREGEGTAVLQPVILGFGPDPDERRARGPHSLAESDFSPGGNQALPRAGSNLLHINAGSALLVLAASDQPMIPFLFFPIDDFCGSGSLFDVGIVAVVQYRPGRQVRSGGDGDRPLSSNPVGSIQGCVPSD